MPSPEGKSLFGVEIGRGRGNALGRRPRRRRQVLVLLLLPLCLSMALFLTLLLLSPGRPKPFLDPQGKPIPGSLSEKLRFEVNGVEQGMFLKGRDRTKPVLLFLHGGTGMPEGFLAERYHAGLEECFTVCWWERRGAGLSYSSSVPPQTMTVEQMIADTIAVTNYLRRRFRREKIYLMAHSGGTLIALQAVARSPELYHAYLGVAQMSHQLKSENVAYEYMLEKALERADSTLADRLRKARPTMSIPLPSSYMELRDEAMHALGVGTTHEMRSVLTGVFLPSWLCREYTISEKIRLWRGKLFSDRMLWDAFLATDLTETVKEVEIPVYFFHGLHDYTVAFPLTKAYFGKLKAPLKGFYTFHNSAHCPIFEEPARTREILEQDVLKGAKSLADPDEGSSE